MSVVSEHTVDVIIPVHSPARPVARAVASVLDATAAPVRVIVVAHNTDPESIRAALGEFADHPGVDLLELHDGIRSPAGPRNHGIDHASAPYLSFLDSDDTLRPGALDSWLAFASSGAEAVLARIERAGSDAPDPLPPTRPGRTRNLDPVIDRLPYRNEPVGLLSRTRFDDLRYTPGLASGEDLELSARIWFSGASIAYDRHGPAYVFGDDAEDRVTAVRRSLDEDFAFLEVVAEGEWFRRLSRRQRRVFGVKVFRLHFFDAVLARLHADGGLAAHRQEFAALVRRIEGMAPGSLALLSRRDRAAIDATLSHDSDAALVMSLLEARWLGGVDAILTRNPLLSLHRQGPRRTLRDMTV